MRITATILVAAAVMSCSLWTAPTATAETYYKNCSEARAAGAAPIYKGEPGYSSKLDRDGDGVACE